MSLSNAHRAASVPSAPNATPLPGSPPSANALSVSIVVYRLNEVELAVNLGTLRLACEQAGLTALALTLIDNSEQGAQSKALHALAERTGWPHAAVLSGHGNVGYGAGHNLAIRAATTPAHLVLNPDVEVDANALRSGLATLTLPGVVLVGAVGRDSAGKPGYLSKRMPSVWTFFLRGFSPAWLKLRFDAQLAHYEYRDLPTDRVSEVILVSGAFMLCRTDALRAVDGFDEHYFLHFEDLDLSLRLARRGRVVSDPQVTLIHHGGNSASRGLAHLRVFVRSGLRFFNAHGWRLL